MQLLAGQKLLVNFGGGDVCPARFVRKQGCRCIVSLHNGGLTAVSESVIVEVPHGSESQGLVSHR